nr:hypothetical protein 8 [bacterium]
MSKKEMYFQEAKHLYVVEQKGVCKIARYFGIAPSTISRWKQSGDWDRKREELTQFELNTLKTFCSFGIELLSSINNEIYSGEGLDPKKMYMFKKIYPSILEIAFNNRELNID